jgi:hypothetical protein
MKKIMLGLLMLTSVSAFAGNEGPNAAPQLPPIPVVATVQIASFFHPPGSPDTIRVEIMKDGQILRTEVYRDQKVITKQVATLSHELSRAIDAAVSKVKPGKLIDPNPKSPGCMDAPSVNYSVTSDNGKIDIGATVACKEMIKDNGDENDGLVRRALEAADSLSSLIP